MPRGIWRPGRFQPQETGLPAFLANISYDQYRMLRFDKAHALWRGAKLPWQVEFFHRGSIYQGRVDVNEVADGLSRPVRYSPDQFSFGGVQRPTNEDLGFAGFRLHAPLNRPDYFDEVCAFLGASYFRAVAKGLGYGLSARGLAIKTADQGGEEFPYFRTFWIERPKPGPRPTPITVHALLDSQSASAAFRFVIAPGTDTVFDTAVTLFPRVDIDQAGIAPLTSMFLFDGNGRHRGEDWRPAVHDSDGLLMLTGHGETLWRPLANPSRLHLRGPFAEGIRPAAAQAGVLRLRRPGIPLRKPPVHLGRAGRRLGRGRGDACRDPVGQGDQR